MSDWFLLYLLTVANSVNDLTGIIGIFAAVLSVVLGIVLGVAYADDPRNKWDDWRDRFNNLRKLFIAGLALMFVASLIPSRNDIIFIVGGAKILELTRTDRVQGIGDKTLGVVEKWLEDNLKEDDKQGN